MNRTLACAAALLFVMLLAVPAAGQVSLTVGSVRDQDGSPIEGAAVSGQTASGAIVSATTDASGTFVIRGTGIAALKISCRYCAPTLASPKPNEPVVIIVRRYLALLQAAPSRSDLENLPYAHIESALGLRPFWLLAQSSTPYPGPRLSDRGLSSAGSLLVDDGAPNYDITNGQSPYVFIPANYEQSATLRDATNAFLYGDQAGGGVVELEPFTAGSNAQIATVGSDTIARAQVGSDSSGIAAGSFTNNDESRQRTDLFGSWRLPADQSLNVAAGTEQGRVYQFPGASFAGSFSFGDATFSDPRALNLYLSAVADRGDYTMSQGEYPISTAWSDWNFAAGIRTTGALSGFADFAVRSSTGFYDPQALPVHLPRVGAMLSQTRADIGLRASGRDYDILAGLGAFWVNYAGGTLGISQPAKTASVLPSVNAQFFPNGKFSVNLQGSSSFLLPDFVDQYQFAAGQPMPVGYERDGFFAEALTYTDTSRLRLSFEHAAGNAQGIWTGTVTSTGFAAVWQVTPALALRAWTMHVSDNIPLYGGGLPYNGAAPTVNAVWLTYDTGAAVRVDAIYRRDLLNGAAFYHFDGAISGPIRNGLRWYAGAEDRMHRTFVDAGLRFFSR
ncbi:MAG TPA: carboxypeptidase regulatory-like domain-containing protein [Candidatus Cybelea sp.]|nr:carboxypeptidase regulatory-like domain-containing protein [Candidatus Cybelea sp.]